MKKILAIIISLPFLLMTSLINANTLDGWTTYPLVSSGASSILPATKDALKSSALITPAASDVGKVLVRGAGGYALTFAVEQLLGAVDWVMDPANNSIKYKVKVNDQAWDDPSHEFYYINNCNHANFSSVYDAFYAVVVYCNISQEWTGAVTVTSYVNNYASGTYVYTYNGETRPLYDQYILKLSNPNYDPAASEEKTLSIDAVAAQVISNASANNADAQLVTVAAADDILNAAADDEEKAEPIIDELEDNAHTSCDPTEDENCKKDCDPPAGVKFNIVTHYTKHGRNPDPNAGSHGCMAKTGSPIHWHYAVNDQLPDGSCSTRPHVFGGCGIAP